MKKAMNMPGIIVSFVLVLAVILVLLFFFLNRADTTNQNFFDCETKGFSCVPAESCSEMVPYNCKEEEVCCKS